VKGAKADQVFAVGLEHHASRFSQALNRDFLFQLLDFLFRDMGHPFLSADEFLVITFKCACFRFVSHMSILFGLEDNVHFR
jgi:hypothetical protein